MTVRIAKGVRDALASQEPEVESLSLLLRTRGDRQSAVAAVNRAFAEAHRVIDERDAASGDPDPPFAGEWFCGPTEKGVLISTDKCRRMDEMVSVIAELLTGQGVDGALDLRPSSKPLTPPLRAPILECRVRIRGRRLRRSESGGYSWEPSESALATWIEVAERWRRTVPAPIAASLRLEGVGPSAVAVDEDVRETVLDARRDGQFAHVASMGAARFHAYGVRHLGSVSLVSGVVGEEEELDWQDALAGFTGLLRASGDLLAYAWVCRDGSVGGALGGYESWSRRPPRATAAAAAAATGLPWYRHGRPKGSWFTREAFDDVIAPDAFGVQLLGPGYRDRIPALEHWQVEDLDAGAVLLSHEDPAAWFAQPEPPLVLDQARDDLADLLYDPERFRTEDWEAADSAS